MKNLIEITNKIIRKHETQKKIHKFAIDNVGIPSPIDCLYSINSLDEMKNLPDGSIAIYENKIYMNVAMRMPTEILTLTGDIEW